MAALYVGVLLVFIGMGTVFAFLGLMVWCVATSSRYLARFAHLMPEKEAQRGRKQGPKPPGGPTTPDAVIPVITAAIHQHISDRS